MNNNDLKNRYRSSRPRNLLIMMVAILTGITIGYFLNNAMGSFRKHEAMHYEIRTSGYQYINPLLDCELAEDAYENRAIQPVEKEVEDIIEDRLSGGLISDASIYFRDLNKGSWFSIRPEDTFSPASLLKVPLMISILKQAESDPGLLGHKIRFSGSADHNSIQNFKPEETLAPGEFYTIDELLHRMIAFSDNNASALLEDFFGVSVLQDVYRVVGLEWPSGIQNNTMSVESYARFFRILFNASYLGSEMSEKALTYIAEVNLRDGLITAVPGSIHVAHKFGELFNPADGARQLHECGIVYYPYRPYLLCIMTRGPSFDDLDHTINEVSRAVYDSMERQHNGSFTSLSP